ncbi:MAG: DNA-processing protein DprA, partial [Pseudomonadota bacterium]
LRLVRTEGVGPVTFRELINRCGGAERAIEALPELAAKGGRRAAPRIFAKSAAETELAEADRLGARPRFTIEPGYPRQLAFLDHPPPMIYVTGRAELLDRPAVALVGSRDASANGLALARRFAQDLVASGFVVVSGLARGIDGAAHRAAVDGGTVAVIAGGPDSYYPPEHAELQARIARDGAVVTEQPPGFKPRGKDFPRRNRIIAGLSLGVVIVEAAMRSGSLISARLANEAGREVFAVPGHPADPRAAGANGLIKQGATLVETAADVMTALGPATGARPVRVAEPALEPPASPPSPAPDPPRLDLTDDARRAVAEALGPSPAPLDEIIRASGLTAREVQVAILELALAGRVEHHQGNLVSARFA